MEDHIITALLNKYINNNCSKEELQIVLEWLKSSNKTTYIDEVIEPLWSNINNHIKRPEGEREEELLIEVSSLLQKIKQKEIPLQKRPLQETKSAKQPFHIIYKIAAVIIIALSITFGVREFRSYTESPITYIEHASSSGQHKTILLADGTNVTLNSESKLIVSSDFNKNHRIIEMEGEGFFEVAPNSQKPFIIKSGETQVKVLGTSFDFKSYKEDDFIKLTVSTGKVQVNLRESDVQLTILPNEHLSINKIDGNIIKESIKENNYNKWMKGSLYFNKEPIQEVINVINRTYKQEVVLDCGNCDFKITGIHDNKNIEAVINAICFTTGLSQRIKGNKIILYNKQNNPK